jgi:hypothetical protein
MPRSEPRGQLLIIVAFGMVVLLAIAALVVDLGFSWMLHRQEQNAADPGSIAAARWLKDATGKPRSPFPEAYAEACFYAQENGFFKGDVGCVAALAPGGGLEVHWPPISGDFVGAPGKVQVIITSTHPSFFAKIFGQDWATVSTSATAANDAGNSNSSALVALQSDCAGGAAGKITGGGTVRIFPANPTVTSGGYVHVNSSCGTSADDVCQNGVGTSALAISGTLITPYAYVNGSCTYNGVGAQGLMCQATSPCLDEDNKPPLGDPLAGLPEPNLANFPNGKCPDGTFSTPTSTSGCQLKKGPTVCPDPGTGIGVCHLTAGVYYGGWKVLSNVTVKLDPGMYILAGGGISLSGSSTIEAITDVTGTIEPRITIFSTDGPGCPTIGAQCQGAITFTANQAFKAKATNTASCQAIVAAGGPNTCPWRGILLWQDGSASNATATVKLGGQASTIMSGTIYAPLAEVDINGGTATTGCSGSPSASCLSIQIVAYRWKIDGGALVDMPYDPAELYQLDLRGLVH